MNQKKAKRIRRAILPAKTKTGMSRGRFMRLLTTHKEENTGSVKYISWPLQQVYGKIPYKCKRLRVDPDCPRGKYLQIKRIVRNDRR